MIALSKSNQACSACGEEMDVKRFTLRALALPDFVHKDLGSWSWFTAGSIRTTKSSASTGTCDLCAHIDILMLMLRLATLSLFQCMPTKSKHQNSCAVVMLPASQLHACSLRLNRAWQTENLDLASWPSILVWTHGETMVWTGHPKSQTGSQMASNGG